MNDAQPAKRGGAAAMLALFCVALGGAGLAFDLTNDASHGFWIGAQQGAGGVIGLIAALFVVLAGHLARLLLKRRARVEQGDV